MNFHQYRILVRVVKELVLRSNGAIRAGSNPAVSNIKNFISKYHIFLNGKTKLCGEMVIAPGS